MQKEVLIDHKLAAVSKLLMATHESVTSNWKVMIEEDRLLTRIDILERQLETSHKVSVMLYYFYPLYERNSPVDGSSSVT